MSQHRAFSSPDLAKASSSNADRPEDLSFEGSFSVVILIMN